jgi:acyl-CoA thioesterase FadM
VDYLEWLSGTELDEDMAYTVKGYDVLCGWLQLGFVDFLLMFGESPGTEPQVAMINLKTEFLGEVFFGKNVEIITRVTKLGNSSFVLHHEMHQNEKLCVSAVTTFVCFDYKKRKSRAIPKSVSQKIRKHLAEAKNPSQCE